MKAKQATRPTGIVAPKPCIVCGKMVNAWYGTWGVYGDAGTCSKSCEMEQERRSRYTFFGDFDFPENENDGSTD